MSSQWFYLALSPSAQLGQTELTGGAHSAMQLFQKFPSVGLRRGSEQAPYECEERNWSIRGFSFQGVEPQDGWQW